MDESLVHGQLHNGLSYFIANCSYPPDRIYLRLVVRVGSDNESEDEAGLAHIVEHLAFRKHKMRKTGSSFPVHEFLERIGAMLGPDSNALTSWTHTGSVSRALVSPLSSHHILSFSMKLMMSPCPSLASEILRSCSKRDWRFCPTLPCGLSLQTRSWKMRRRSFLKNGDWIKTKISRLSADGRAQF